MAQRPGWQDYVSEGVIDHVPDPGPDGVPEAVAPTPEASARAYEMNLRAEMIEAEHVEQRMGTMPRVRLKGPDGKPRTVTEKNAERADRKFHAIRTGVLTAVCKPCGRQVELPERVLRYGLRKPRCKECGRPLSTYVSLRRS